MPVCESADCTMRAACQMCPCGTFYCSKACQKSSWKNGHRKVCTASKMWQKGCGRAQVEIMRVDDPETLSMLRDPSDIIKGMLIRPLVCLARDEEGVLGITMWGPGIPRYAEERKQGMTENLVDVMKEQNEMCARKIDAMMDPRIYKTFVLRGFGVMTPGGAELAGKKVGDEVVVSAPSRWSTGRLGRQDVESVNMVSPPKPEMENGMTISINVCVKREGKKGTSSVASMFATGGDGKSVILLYIFHKDDTEKFIKDLIDVTRLVNEFAEMDDWKPSESKDPVDSIFYKFMVMKESFQNVEKIDGARKRFPVVHDMLYYLCKAKDKFLAAPITITYLGSSKKSKYVQYVRCKYPEGAYIGADKHLGIKFSSWEFVEDNEVAKKLVMAKEEDERMGAKTKTAEEEFSERLKIEQEVKKMVAAKRYDLVGRDEDERMGAKTTTKKMLRERLEKMNRERMEEKMEERGMSEKEKKGFLERWT